MSLSAHAPTLVALAVLAGGCGAAPVIGDGGASDAGAVDVDAGAVSLAGLPGDAWSFVPVPGAVCGNGSTAAIGVSPHPGATELLIFMAGGGACWDADTCFARSAATHIAEDYTRAMFDEERAILAAVGWDDRAAAANPFRASHIVYLPYCSGDLHAGDSVQSYVPSDPTRRVHHRGAVNTQRYVDAMRAAWPELQQVRVIGLSAGGYGAQLNWGRFADAWPDAALSILADGAPLAQPDAPLYATWRASWNLFTPAGCTGCVTSFPAYDDHFDAAYPSSRFGLVTTTGDAVLSGYWGVSDFPVRVNGALDVLDDNATTRYFAVDSDHHVILGESTTLRGSDGTLLLDWVVGWFADDTRWHNVRP